MDKMRRRLLGAALGAAACLTLWSARGEVAPFSPSATRYITGCAIIDATTVEGFVTNTGPVLIQLNGQIRFSVIPENSASHPTVQVQSSILVPPGRTVNVGRAQMPWALLPGQSCQLDVSEAVR